MGVTPANLTAVPTSVPIATLTPPLTLPLPTSTPKPDAVQPSATTHQTQPSPPTASSPTITPTSTPVLLSLSYIHDLTFVDAMRGWLLGASCDDDNHCSPEMRATTDGGITWQKIATPDAGVGWVEKKGTTRHVDHVRFMTAMEGWAFGPSLFSTHDGGKTWIEENVDGEIVALEPKDGSVWAIGRVCTAKQQSKCMSQTALLVLDPNTHAWRPVSAQPPVGSRPTLVRASTMDAWIFWDDGSPMVATHDGGKSWREVALPKDRDCGLGSRIAALANGEVWYFCTYQGGAGSQAKMLYVSNDGGVRWTSVAHAWPNQPDYPDNLPYTSYLYGFTASSPDHVWALYGGDIAGDTESKDGGRTWQWVSAECSQDGSIFFLDANHGWIGGNNSISRTTDGGATWEHYIIYPPHARGRG